MELPVLLTVCFPEKIWLALHITDYMNMLVLRKILLLFQTVPSPPNSVTFMIKLPN